MRLDHLALRVPDRHRTAKFFVDVFGYRYGQGEGLVDGGFTIDFDDGSTANCLVLEPPEKSPKFKHDYPWHVFDVGFDSEYHIPPDLFISDPLDKHGKCDFSSIIGKWVESRKGKGYLHHMAYLVDDVKKKMREWIEKGYAEFTTESPIVCPGELVQCFTKPSELTGIIYELIERESKSFCQKSVAKLMISTKDFS